MSISVGSMSAGLGLDLTEFQNGMQRATDLARNNTTLMSAEMKRTSREGAEALRLIDESLGIHMSRPLTRILTQEFPAFAAGLQTVLGGAVFGAVATVAFEAFEKVSRSIEKAQKAQEKFAESTRNEKSTFDDIIASFDKSEKLHSLAGLDKKLFEIDSSSVEETHRKIDELTKALEENAKAAAAAGGWWTKFLAAVGDAAHATFSSEGEIDAEKIDAQLGEFKNKLHELARIDGLNQTHYSAAAINAELDAASRRLQQLQSNQAKTEIIPPVELEAATEVGVPGSPEELAALQRYIDGLKQLQQVQGAGDVGQGRAEGAARMAAAEEALKAAHAEMVKDFQEDAAIWNATANALYQVLAASEKLSQTSLVDAANRYKEFQKINGPVTTVAPPPGAPQLPDQIELQKVTDDQNESRKKAGEILASIETPQEKYNTQLAILRTLEDQGRISSDQLTAAQQKLKEELAQATDKLENLLKKTGDASAGFQAFILQMQKTASRDGAFTFDILNKGLDGFESNTVTMLMTGKAHWQSYFNDLAAMALKFLLNKEIASILGGLFGGLSFGPGAAAQFAAGPGTLFSGLTGAASGSDYTPGGPMWVGEQGPEIVNLPRGSSVTSNSALRAAGGGNTSHYYDFRGAVVTDDLLRKADAARMSVETKRQAVGEAMANFSEVQKRTLQQR